MTTRLIIDLATDRILWFTSDLSIELHKEEYSITADFDGNLPTELNLQNCWNYRLRNQQIEYAGPPKRDYKVVSNLDLNKASMLKYLSDNIEITRQQFLPKTVGEYLADLEYVKCVNLRAEGKSYNTELLDLININHDCAAEFVIQKNDRVSKLLAASESVLVEYKTKINNSTDPVAVAMLKQEINNALTNLNMLITGY